MTPLRRLIDHLGRLQVAETQRRVLQEAGERLRTAVVENLSHTPDESHDTPWLRTGALRDSIGIESGEDAVVVGSSSPAAAAQELGSAALQPRPFLAPAAVDLAGPVAEAIGAAFADLLHGRETG